MEIFSIKNLSFAYSQSNEDAIKNISFSVNEGEFILLCGESGSGKTTLLRLLKNELAPVGKKSGDVLFCNKDIALLSPNESAQSIGFVMQNPENQTVTDRVNSELCFGLENIGVSQGEIRRRVAETAGFFGITDWFQKKTSELSGGQMQILNLASVMAMRPRVLILDEPTSRLDPVAAADFFASLKRLNTNLGITVILSEHRLEDVFSLADRVICLNKGSIVCDCLPQNAAQVIKNSNEAKNIFLGLPAAVQIYSLLGKNGSSPVSVKEGRSFVTDNYKNDICEPKELMSRPLGENAAELKDVWFRYEKNSADILRGTCMQIKKGEIYALLGGNGAGKTTLLDCIAGIKKPYRGKIEVNSKKLKDYKDNSLYLGVLSYLPQNPQTLFCSQSVQQDLNVAAKALCISKEQQLERINYVIELTEIKELLQKHPYDLSGGEQQKCALAKVLLSKPSLLLLDEPTKGLDAGYCQKLGKILQDIAKNGVAVLLVTHDVEFSASYANTAALYFNGEVFDAAPPDEFFSGLDYYTTAAARIVRGYYSHTVTPLSVAEMCKINGQK